jgi:phosphomannomutase
MAGVFKAYDIRGIYGDTLTEELAEKIGRAFVTFLKCNKVVIGHDMRPHSKPLLQALAKGITESGADVIDSGMCSTPMLYYAVGVSGAEAGIMITASHNPGEWNGFKLTKAKAVPISGATGIADIEKIVEDESFEKVSDKIGAVSEMDVLADYCKHVQSVANIGRPVKIAADMANAMGVYEARALVGFVEVDPLFEELDGTFPNHEANPLKADTLIPLQEMVKEGEYDFGVAFDGDADRAGFVDENGTVVPMDIMTALIAQDILSHEKGIIFYDLRSSWSVKEVIEESGGTAMMSRVGHAFIKQQMRDSNAIFAGELSGHYYFRENFFTESSAMAVLRVANMISNSGKTLSELTKPIVRYSASGEINSRVEDSDAVLASIKEKYNDGEMINLDGISVEYEDWWFNVRCSNTEPLVRLNIEAKTPEMMAEKRDELLAVIRG